MYQISVKGYEPEFDEMKVFAYFKNPASIDSIKTVEGLSTI